MLKKCVTVILAIAALTNSLSAHDYSVFNNTDTQFIVKMNIAGKSKRFEIDPQQEAKEKTKSNCLTSIEIYTTGPQYVSTTWGGGTYCYDKHLIVNTVKNADGTPVIVDSLTGKKKFFEITERFPKKKKKK